MSNVYTYSDARQNLASLLDEAACNGEVKLRRKDGRVFVIKPKKKPVCLSTFRPFHYL
jgi:hypothetical protein